MPVPAQKSENVGPRYVQFVFVAGRRDELQALRQKLDFYGDVGGLDWHPYWPEVPEEVAIMAQEIASSEKLRYEVIKLDEHIVEQVREAERNNKLVVVVVDTWTLRVQRYRNIMHVYDQNRFLNSILVILWNTQDDETENNRSTLDDTILYTFPSKATSEDAMSALETIKISSANHLKKELSTSLNKTRLKIINIAEVIRKVEGEQIIPTISAS